MVGNNNIGKQAAISSVASSATGSTKKTDAKSGLDKIASVSKAAKSKQPETGSSVSIAAAEATGAVSEYAKALAA